MNTVLNVLRVDFMLISIRIHYVWDSALLLLLLEMVTECDATTTTGEVLSLTGGKTTVTPVAVAVWSATGVVATTG